MQHAALLIIYLIWISPLAQQTTNKMYQLWGMLKCPRISFQQKGQIGPEIGTFHVKRCILCLAW